MKFLLLFLCFYFSVTIHALQLVPSRNGQFHRINNFHLNLLKALKANCNYCKYVAFKLYTNKNPHQAQFVRLYNRKVLAKTNFQPSNPTRFFIHGWQANGDSMSAKLIREAYFMRGLYNIFIVDWSLMTRSQKYLYSRAKVPLVGGVVAKFIDFLNDAGRMNFNTLYLIGHNLGAHIAGYAGKLVKRGRINTIFGLDPSGPLFTKIVTKNRLTITDADYVETIHTNGGLLGFYYPIGHTSFYPNWGQLQPGCGKDPSGLCSHGRAIEYFVESLAIENHFIARNCESFQSILEHVCFSYGKSAKMGGEPSNYSGKARGIYYLITHPHKPYAAGI